MAGIPINDFYAAYKNKHGENIPFENNPIQSVKFVIGFLNFKYCKLFFKLFKSEISKVSEFFDKSKSSNSNIGQLEAVIVI